MRRVVGVVQERMGSMRLPGKALLPVGGTTALAYLVSRVRRAASLDQLVIATSTRAENDAIVVEAARIGIDCFRGDEDNVLKRITQTGQAFGADVVVRITADDVLMDPQVVNYMVERFRAGSQDWATSLTSRSFPNGFVLSVLSMNVLERADALSVDTVAREHLLPALLSRPDLFPRLDVTAPPQWSRYEMGVTLDTREDYELVCEVVNRFGATHQEFGLEDVLTLLLDSPSLSQRARRAGAYWEQKRSTATPAPSA